MATEALRDWELRANGYGSRKMPFFFAIDFEAEKPVLYSWKECRDKGILWSFPGRRQSIPSARDGKIIRLQSHPVNKEEFEKAFDIVMRGLQYGDSFLTNLTFSTPVQSEFTLREIYSRSRAPYKLYWPDQCVVFSPERFVQIRSGRIRTFPMKGTLKDVGGHGADSLMQNLKEHEEQATVVDLMRNDISMVARGVRVERFRYAEAIHTPEGKIWQTSSEISGKLPAFFHEKIGSLIATMLPAGSISGAPKKRTVEIIREAEGAVRGWYTGIYGYFDGQILDSAVMIRYIEKTENGLAFRSGGGITVRSTASQEYQEMLDKIYVPVY